MPAGLAARAAAVAAGTLAVTPARDAASVLLLRDAPAVGIEVFCVRRPRAVTFAGGMWAFPGGALEPGDGDWTGVLPPAWAPALDRAGTTTPVARAVVGAAVRETFEECGVWLAGGRPPPQGAAVRLAGRRLRTDLMRPWARWVTPEAEPVRFDARFFVARLPGETAPKAAAAEADEGRWVGAGEHGGLPMLPPTAHLLSDLAAYRSLSEALAASRRVVAVLPVVALRTGRAELVMPWEEGYPR